MPQCPGAAGVGQYRVITNPGLPASKATDPLTCCGRRLSSGSFNVIIANSPGHRTGDRHPCGGHQVKGSRNVIVGP